MNFHINSDDSDITQLANALRDWEQDGKDLPPEKRALLNLSAHMLETCRSQMLSTAEELEKALALKTGYSDSDSRQIEVAQKKQSAVKEQVGFLRQLLSQKLNTPITPQAPKPKREVI